MVIAKLGFLTGKALEDMSLDELDEIEDEEEERILEQYRRERMAQIKNLQQRSRFGDVRDISADDYVEQVNHDAVLLFLGDH
jgi:hypothetical protein